jgi:hypothetical protein
MNLPHTPTYVARLLGSIAGAGLLAAMLFAIPNGTVTANARLKPPAACLRCEAWTMVPSPNRGQTSELSGVVAPGSKNAWAVGSSSRPDGRSETLVERWNGGLWSIVHSPNVGAASSFLAAVAASGKNDVWAVGYSTKATTRSLVEHWNGTKWRIVSSPSPGGSASYLTGIVAVSRTNAWAVGEYMKGSFLRTLIEHWNGSRWSVVPSRNIGGSNNFLTGVAAVKPTAIWAVGYDEGAHDGIYRTEVQKWNAAAWNVVPSPNAGTSHDFFRGDGLTGVAAVGGRDIWTSGYHYISSRSVNQTLTEHWNGAQWQIAPSPNLSESNNALTAVAAIAANNVWVVGGYNDSQGHLFSLTERWNGRAWGVVPSPSPGSIRSDLQSLAADPARRLWAVGSYNNSSGLDQTFILHYVPAG